MSKTTELIKKIEARPKFGKLQLVGNYKKIETGKSPYYLVTCICDCGKTKDIRWSNILAGKSESCGCMTIKNSIRAHTRSGMSSTPIYNIWHHLKDRCNRKKNPKYKNYGGRGITYDPRWNKFEAFYEDMGSSYQKGLTIDRIDNDGNYCKENCKWSTNSEQAQNKTTTLQFYVGKTLVSMSKFCRLYNLTRTDYKRLHRKVKKGIVLLTEVQNCTNSQELLKLSWRF